MWDSTPPLTLKTLYFAPMNWEHDICPSSLIKNLMLTCTGPKDILQMELLVFLILSNPAYQRECITWPDWCSYWFEVHSYLVLLATHLQPGGRHPCYWMPIPAILWGVRRSSLLGWLGCPLSTAIASFMSAWLGCSAQVFGQTLSWVCVLGCFIFHGFFIFIFQL